MSFSLSLNFPALLTAIPKQYVTSSVYVHYALNCIAAHFCQQKEFLSTSTACYTLRFCRYFPLVPMCCVLSPPLLDPLSAGAAVSLLTPLQTCQHREIYICRLIT